MNNAELIVRQFMKPHHKILRQFDIVVIPTTDCPLPDKTKDLNDKEWAMLCYLVHSQITYGGLRE